MHLSFQTPFDPEPPRFASPSTTGQASSTFLRWNSVCRVEVQTCRNADIFVGPGTISRPTRAIRNYSVVYVAADTRLSHCVRLERNVPHAYVSGGKNVQEAQPYTRNKSSFNIPNGDGAHEEMNKALSRCRASFFRSAYRFLENTADAEDAVQDALLSAYKHIDQFRGEAQMSTWLTAIVANCARMQLRKRPRNIHVSLDEPIGEEQELPMSE